jgi:hypothetical protein
MYYTQKYYPNTQTELLNVLNESVSGKSKIAIVGGHFMLLYDKTDDDLKPVIIQEFEKENLKMFAKQFAGNLPLSSFKFSVELFKNFKKQNIESGIILLVNDHKFQSVNFQPDIVSSIKGRGGELRKEYFSRNIIPNCYIQVLDSERISVDHILIDNNDIKRHSSDLLPKKSWFYSEKRLKNRFDYFVKIQLMKRGIIREDIIGDKVELFYESPNNGNNFCLTENGSCACSAEIIEFITNLLGRNINEIFIMVPDECVSAVDNGIFAALNICEVFAKVTTITGFGGMGIDENLERSYIVTEHIYE